MKRDTSDESFVYTSYLIHYNLDSMDWSMDQWVCVCVYVVGAGDFLNECEKSIQMPSF